LSLKGKDLQHYVKSSASVSPEVMLKGKCFDIRSYLTAVFGLNNSHRGHQFLCNKTNQMHQIHKFILS